MKNAAIVLVGATVVGAVVIGFAYATIAFVASMI